MKKQILINSISIRCLVSVILLCAACSRQPKVPVKDAEKVDVAPAMPAESEMSTVPIEDLRKDAEAGQPASQRELAGRFLFGEGIPADAEAAVVWARKAALNGDDTAALWTGRAELSDPAGRIEAAAWFLIGKTDGNATIRQDAAGEIESMGLSDEELAQATMRVDELRKTIRTNSE